MAFRLVEPTPAYLVQLLLYSLLLTSINSFSASRFFVNRTPSNARKNCLVSGKKHVSIVKGKEDDSTDESSSTDIETARQQFEYLFRAGSSSSRKQTSQSGDNYKNQYKVSLDTLLSTQNEINIPPAPPLTSMDRARRLSEIEVLKRLEDGDEASPELWDLWFSERGKDAKTILQKSDEILQGYPSKWDQCEENLFGLIETYGVHFVEPLNRLATLYYFQGRYDESLKLCKMVLEIKPWHIGALSGIVAVCIAKGDREEARFWANKRLPTFAANSSLPPFTDNGPTNPKRVEWVQQAVQDAERALSQAEKSTKADFFGKPEEYYCATAKHLGSKKASNEDLQVNNNNDESVRGSTDDDWQ